MRVIVLVYIDFAPRETGRKSGGWCLVLTNRESGQPKVTKRSFSETSGESKTTGNWYIQAIIHTMLLTVISIK
jgi:hypothetical protein